MESRIDGKKAEEMGKKKSTHKDFYSFQDERRFSYFVFYDLTSTLQSAKPNFPGAG